MQVFDPPEGSYGCYKTSTRAELEELLNSDLLRDSSKLHFIECILGNFDAPRALLAVSLYPMPDADQH
jgi:TPP-dependent 2-oxoacid decarboxylase